MIRQVLEGVAYLHKKGIVHRDLKLENLLLVDDSPRAFVKIADFGLSKVFSKDTTLSTVCGSPQYMAPELLMMESNMEYSPAVDVWSMGVILFILLVGYSPFGAPAALTPAPRACAAGVPDSAASCLFLPVGLRYHVTRCQP